MKAEEPFNGCAQGLGEPWQPWHAAATCPSDPTAMASRGLWRQYLHSLDARTSLRYMIFFLMPRLRRCI